MRTLLTTGGIAISVAFVIFLVSLGLGLQQISTKQIANLEALQILDVVSGKSKAIFINDDVLKKFKLLPNVVDAQPQLSLASSLKYNTSEVDGVVYGKNSEYITLESTKIVSGRKYTSNNEKEALVNLAAQTQFSASDIIGKEITISSIIKNDLLDDGKETKKVSLTFKVVGIIDDSSAPYVYVPLEILKQEGIVNYSGAKIKLDSKDNVDKVKLIVENMGYKVSSIKDTVDQINQFFNIFQLILVSFGAIAIVVACLGMFNTLTISLLEKTREVGFMKALGTTRRDIYVLFISESILIGILGSFVGISTGVLIGAFLNYSISRLAESTGNLPVQLFHVTPKLIILTITASILISFFTGFYPSKRAAKINPLDALRYE
jgi:putative ABC transport system permease protein